MSSYPHDYSKEPIVQAQVVYVVQPGEPVVPSATIVRDAPPRSTTNVNKGLVQFLKDEVGMLMRQIGFLKKTVTGESTRTNY